MFELLEIAVKLMFWACYAAVMLTVWMVRVIVIGIAYLCAAIDHSIKQSQARKAAVAASSPRALGAAPAPIASAPSLRAPTPVVAAPVASETRSYTRRAGEFRCQENDHLLSADHATCPIDGSVVTRVTL